MINVYAWPPVGVTGRSWQLVQPVARVRSGLTGREQIQTSQRARRMVALDVSALARETAERQSVGGGYMEMLGELLAGGVNAVRLTSWAPNKPWGGAPDYQWLSVGLSAVAVTSAGMGAWQVSGLPPRYPLLQPGERFTVGGVVWRAVNNAVASDLGVAVIRVNGATIGTGPLVLGAEETAAFRPEAIPTGKQTPGADWSYSWTFREVFADEVGGFVEVDPWT